MFTPRVHCTLLSVVLLLLPLAPFLIPLSLLLLPGLVFFSGCDPLSFIRVVYRSMCVLPVATTLDFKAEKYCKTNYYRATGQLLAAVHLGHHASTCCFIVLFGKLFSFPDFFLRVEEKISLILSEFKTKQEKHPKPHGDQKTRHNSSPHTPLAPEWGHSGGGTAGRRRLLNLNPILQVPGLQGRALG